MPPVHQTLPPRSGASDPEDSSSRYKKREEYEQMLRLVSKYRKDRVFCLFSVLRSMAG